MVEMVATVEWLYMFPIELATEDLGLWGMALRPLVPTSVHGTQTQPHSPS